MSGIITEPGFLAVFPKMNSNYKKGAIQALVVAIYEIGCLLGSFFIIGPLSSTPFLLALLHHLPFSSLSLC